MERLDREPRSNDAPPEPRPLLRILRLLKPYGGFILLVVLCTLVFSAGRYGRAYLMKPLLDGVLVPVETASQATPARAGPLDSLVDPLSRALIPLLPDSPQDEAGPGASKPSEREVRQPSCPRGGSRSSDGTVPSGPCLRGDTGRPAFA